MSTLSEHSSIGQIIGYTILCGAGFGAVSAYVTVTSGSTN